MLARSICPRRESYASLGDTAALSDRPFLHPPGLRLRRGSRPKRLGRVPKREEDLLRASDAGRPEVARLVAHLGECASCRSLALSLVQDRPLPAKRQDPLRTLLEFAKYEEGEEVERLLARAEFAALRRLTRGAQKERVIHTPSCHAAAFIDVLSPRCALRTRGARPRAFRALRSLPYRAWT